MAEVLFNLKSLFEQRASKERLPFEEFFQTHPAGALGAMAAAAMGAVATWHDKRLANPQQHGHDFSIEFLFPEVTS